MKVHFLCTLDCPLRGGSYNFLRILREAFRRRNVYAETPDAADAVLAHAYVDAVRVLAFKRERPRVPVIHRVDGPVRLHTPSGAIKDRLVWELGQALADGVIYQSRWSRDENRRLGASDVPRETIIWNAPDPARFHPPSATPSETALASRPLRIIATSWSSNWNKGFDIYARLDEQLDMSRFRLTCVGNAPTAFRRIVQAPVQDHAGLSALLREHHVYLTASRAEACSNALLEALHCGLPALGLNSGSTPELIGRGGEIFETVEEIPALLEKIAADRERYVQAIAVPSLEEVADRYYAFMDMVRREAEPRPLGALPWLRLRARAMQLQYNHRLPAWLQPRR